MNEKYLWWVMIPIWGVGAWFAFNSDISITWRFTVIFGFLLLCPGGAYIRFLPVSDKLSQVPLTIALSFLFSSIVALGMIYLKIWEPQYGLMVLIGLAIVGVILQIVSDTHKMARR
jgi:uncharacterized membrane protein